MQFRVKMLHQPKQFEQVFNFFFQTCTFYTWETRLLA